MRYALNGGIDVGIGIDDDSVFAAHLKNGALDPHLARRLGGRHFVDVQTDFARTGEGDESSFGMRDHGIAEAGSGAGTEIHHALRHPRFFEQFDKLRGDGRRVARRLQDHRVAAHDRRHCHSGHDGAGKIPRRNHGAHAQGNVHQSIALPGQLNGCLGLRESQGLAGIELAEIDRLGNVGVGLSPVLADLEDQPRHEFHLALAQQITDAVHQAGALFDGSAAPGFEGGERGLHRRLDVFSARFLMDADNLRRLRRVQRFDLVGSLEPLAADDEVILVAQLSAHLGDGCTHAARILFIAEIEKGLGNKRTLMQRRARPYGRFSNRH